MTGTVATQVKAIAFDRDIERLTQGFTGREWIFEEIDRWLQQDNERFFILTGEPGVGKSAIAARLTQIRDDIAAYHFCRAGDVETVRPGRILRSLAAQLGEHLPDYGQALANTIKPVHLRVEVNINIGSMTGSQVTGVYIENLKESDPENELDILIRAPLEELQKMYAERQQAQPTLAIILIDSLDEAVTTTGTNLVKLLTQLSKSTSLPFWVRFVMTSRPERRVLRGFEPLEPYHLREKSDESLADVQQYVEERVNQSALQDQLQVNQVQPQTLITEITDLSHGNFLYTTLLLNDIEAGRQALDNLAALPKSIDDIYHGFLSRFSEEDWSDRYKPIFGLLTVAQKPISEKLISNFTKIDPEDVRDSIRIARQFFDVEVDEQNKETYSIFHQSLRDYLLDEDRNADFWCNERKQHQRIITFCEKASKAWQELERIDSYGQKYLAQHLVKGDRVEELHTLLSLEKDRKNAWFKVKDDEGDTSGFLADIELAWAQADAAYETEPGRSIGLQCRYALIKASVNRLAEIPRELLVALVKFQCWKPAKALTYARQISDPQKRCESLAALADQIPSSEPLKSQALKAALESALAIQSNTVRARTLTALADNLPDALSKALEAVQTIRHHYSRLKILEKLVDKLDSDSLSKALEIALAFPDGLGSDANYRAKALTALADRLTPELLPTALEASLAIRYEYDRVQALTALADRLTPELLPTALEAALAIQDGYYRAKVLTALGGKLPDALPKALEAVLAIQIIRHNDDVKRAEALTVLADKLPEVLPKALEAALNLYEDGARAEALTALADKLPDTLPKALEAALADGGAWPLIDLVDKLPEVLPKALEVALAYSDCGHRSLILITLVGKLTPSLLPKALEAALSIQDDGERSEFLIALANKLTPNLLPKVLEIALNIQDDYSRAKALTALLDKLPDVLPKALEALSAIQIESDIAEVLTDLVDKLPLNLLPKVLEAVLDIPDEYLRAQAVTIFANKLPLNLLPQAVETTQFIQDSDQQVQALKTLTNQLSAALYKALKLKQAIQCDVQRTLALVALTENKLANRLPKILETVQSIENDDDQAWALTILTDKIPEALPKALEIAQTLKGEYRARILVALADKIHPSQYPMALKAIQTSSQYTSRYLEMLTKLINKLPQNFYLKVLEAIQMIQDENYRDTALIALVDRVPEEALQKTLEAVLAIQNDHHRARALIVLAGKDIPDLLPKILKSAQAIKSNSSRAEVLSALVDKLPNVFSQAWESWQQARSELAGCLIPEPYMALQIYESGLMARAKKLPGGLSKALEEVKTITDENHRSKMLIVLAEQLTPDQLTPDLFLKVLEALQMFQGESDVCNVSKSWINNLVRKLSPDLLSQTFEVAPVIWTEISSDYWVEVSRVQLLTMLINKLPNTLPRALKAVQVIQDDYYRTQALTVLVPYLVNHSDRFNLLKDLLHFLSSRTQADLLNDLVALAPVIIVLGSETAAAEAAQAIQDVSRWWS